MEATLMPPGENRLWIDLSVLQTQVAALQKSFAEFAEDTKTEHRKVHDILDALSEAVRNVTRMVGEMKELTDDYREKRAEQRGADRVKAWLYWFWASIGGLVAVALGKLWDALPSFVGKPHP